MAERPSLQRARAVAIGDINGDGQLDITTGSSVLLGAADGTFRSRINYAFIGSSSALGDMDGDGKLDVLTTFQDGVNVPINSCRLRTGAGHVARPRGAQVPRGLSSDQRTRRLAWNNV